MLDAPVTERAAALNDRFRHHAAIDVLRHTAADPLVGRVALVSSFGAESVALLHMLSVVAPDTPVLFIDTRMLFAETLDYQRQVAARLPLTDIRIIRADDASLAAQDLENSLHTRDPDACCALRKVVPLEHALRGFDAWITGRKRFQGGDRQTLDFFDVDSPTRMRINPLAHWRPQDVRDYMVENNLPAHPLVERGYPSIGCAPCTSPVAAGEDPRAGRWRDSDKSECGIHFLGGRVVRTAAQTNEHDINAEAYATVVDLTDAPMLVRDDGFHPLDDQPAAVLAPDTDPAILTAHLMVPLIAIDFPAMTDGRGFTLARRLRELGFAGRLRATGGLIADQYAMARRVGFDEVQIPAVLARRQPAPQWRARADWQDWDHRARLAG